MEIDISDLTWSKFIYPKRPVRGLCGTWFAAVFSGTWFAAVFSGTWFAAVFSGTWFAMVQWCNGAMVQWCRRRIPCYSLFIKMLRIGWHLFWRF